MKNTQKQALTQRHLDFLHENGLNEIRTFSGSAVYTVRDLGNKQTQIEEFEFCYHELKKGVVESLKEFTKPDCVLFIHISPFTGGLFKALASEKGKKEVKEKERKL